MNVGPAKRVDILGWLNRFELDAVAFSCKFFCNVILANVAVLPLRALETVEVRKARMLQSDNYIIGLTATSTMKNRQVQVVFSIRT